MSSRRQTIGRWGEELAAGWLSVRGYEILARNVRTPYGEIDLVARRDGQLCFVEVKTRTSRAFGLPEESVNIRKQSHMVAAAEHYAAQMESESWQIDVIAVEVRANGEPDVVHFENVL